MTISPPPTDDYEMETWARILPHPQAGTSDLRYLYSLAIQRRLSTPPPPQSGWAEAIEAAAKEADYLAQQARLVMQGDVMGETYLRAKEVTASTIAARIRALPLPPVGTEEE